MNVQTSTTIDASAETLWAILATDYNNIGDWTTAVLHSEQDPDLPEGEGRIIQVPRLGEVREPIRHLDAERRTFTFEVIADGFPFFVKSLLGRRCHEWSSVHHSRPSLRAPMTEAGEFPTTISRGMGCNS